MVKKLNVAIGKDWAGWHEKFAHALEYQKEQGITLSYSILNLDCVNWQELIAPYDIVIWNPSYMGIRLASHFKEKIYFMQYIQNKLVVPNFNTVWHFESKVAESYIFTHNRITTPRTIVSFDFANACHELEKTDIPTVLKKSEGAASHNVKLIRSKKKLERIIENTFCDQLWGEARKGTSKIQFIQKYITKRWFLDRVLSKYKLTQGGEGIIYWQEFIPDNTADLRITVIGDRFAYGFWRNNRPGDFRASGSGLIDYEREISKEVISYCLNINKELAFDSMCYDILFTRDSFVINEMSYNYVDKALFNAPGHYAKSDDGDLSFYEGHCWPQDLWVKWMLIKIGC